MIQFWCPCGRQLQASEEHIGRQAKCPACGEVQTVPDRSQGGPRPVPPPPPPPPPRERPAAIRDGYDDARDRRRDDRDDYRDRDRDDYRDRDRDDYRDRPRR